MCLSDWSFLWITVLDTFKIFIYLFLYYVWIFCLHICLCILGVCARGSSKRTRDPLELEFQMVVSTFCNVNADNQTRVLWEKSVFLTAFLKRAVTWNSLPRSSFELTINSSAAHWSGLQEGGVTGNSEHSCLCFFVSRCVHHPADPEYTFVCDDIRRVNRLSFYVIWCEKPVDSAFWVLPGALQRHFWHKLSLQVNSFLNFLLVRWPVCLTPHLASSFSKNFPHLLYSFLI